MSGYRVSMAELAAMSDEERKKALTKLVEEARKPPTPELMAELRSELKVFEVRYEMTTEEMLAKLVSGEINETLEINRWLFKHEIYQRLGGQS